MCGGGAGGSWESLESERGFPAHEPQRLVLPAETSDMERRKAAEEMIIVVHVRHLPSAGPGEERIQAHWTPTPPQCTELMAFRF